MFWKSFLAGGIVLLFIVSCGRPSDVVTLPSTSPEGARSVSSSHQLLGYFQVSIDPVTLTADINTLRSAQFTCNVVRFMQPPVSPTHMISIKVAPGSDPQNGYFEVDVTLKHPFPGLNLYRGFDVRGIFISNGSITSELDSGVVYAGESDARLLNADGLTRWWNPTEFTSYGTIFGFTPGKLAPPVTPTGTLNGFKYFAEALGYDQPLWELDPASRGTFPTSGAYTRLYKIQFPLVDEHPDLKFNYAVDASWYPPDPEGFPDYPIESFPLSANMAEAYCVSVVDNGSTAYFVDPENKGGKIKLAIRVYDWQAAANPEGVKGEISNIWLESPIFPAPVDVLPLAMVLPDGPTSSVFEVEIGELNLNKSGEEPVLVFVQAADPFGYEPQVEGGDKFAHPSAPLGSYLLTTVEIKSENPSQAPIVTSIEPNHAKSGDILTGVIVSGQFFQSGAQVELRHPDWPSIEASNEVTEAGGTKITCDLDLKLAAEGDWDVVVINPDLQEGVLPAGFHIDCADGIHSYEGKHYLLGGTWNYCQRGDLCILETGPYAGQCVVKSNYTSGGNWTGHYVRFDPDNPQDTAATQYFSVKGSEDGQTLYITMTASLDQNPVNGHIAVINGRIFNKVQIQDKIRPC